MERKEVSLFLVFVSLLVSSLFLTGCPFEPDLSEYNLCTTNNGDLFLKDHALCLTDPGSSHDEFCCYRPDGSKCTDDDVEKLASQTAVYWAYHIDAGDYAGEVYSSIHDEIISHLGGDKCSSTYSITIGEGDDSETLNSLMPWCTDSFEYSQNAIIFRQGMGDDHDPDNPQENIFVCYRNQWYNYHKILEDDEDTDSDGVGLFWDCDESDPHVFSNMSMYYGFTEEPQEICGDKKDNMCLNPFDFVSRGGYDHNIYGHLNFEGVWVEETNDNCDENPEACQQNCLYSGGECDYLGYNDATADVDEVELSLGTGYCCGDNITDLGEIENYEDVERICLNQDYTIPNDLCEEGGWCWVNSEMNQFKIITVKYLGQETFDVFSNYREWQVCSENNIGPVSAHESDLNSYGNRYYCYDEGDHYSYAECSDDGGNTGTIHNVGSIKHRTAAAGTFSLPIIENGNPNRYLIELDGTIGEYTNNYEDLYSIEETLDQTVDFIGYDYLEILFKYTDEVFLPDNINLTIKGLPTDINSEDESNAEYFSQNVLGYAINDPLLEAEHVIHLRVPVGEWPDIKSIDFKSIGDRNTFQVLAMYLTKESDANSDEIPICSGKDSTNYNSWLTDLDDSSESSFIDGTLICDFRYGENAWLGDYYSYEVEEGNTQASCCGDDEGEFYAGISANSYGCFNGIPINNEDTAMQVEFEVEYATQEYNVSYPDNLSSQFSIIVSSVLPEDLFSPGCNYNGDIQALIEEETGNSNCGHVEGSCSCSDSEVTCSLSDLLLGSCIEEYTTYCTFPPIEDCTNCPTGATYFEEYEFSCNPVGYEYLGAITDTSSLEDGQSGLYNGKYYSMDRYVENSQYTFDYNESPIIINDLNEGFTNFLSEREELTITLEYVGSDSEIYLFTPFNQKSWGVDEVINLGQNLPVETDIWIVAETDLIEINSSEGQTETDELSYTCLTDECVYALPGSPPYKITNEHPDLYDLYFHTRNEDDSEEEILITEEEQEFENLGVIIVRSISQQILYNFDQEEETGGFYGCQAAEYVLEAITNGDESYVNNYDYCAVQGDYYCAHQDSQRLVNSWSLDSITQIAYEPVEEWDEDTELTLQSVTYASDQRNYSATVVPQRNFIPNADFETTEEDNADNVAYWTLLDGSDAIVENEINEREDGIMDINSAYTFISDNIAIQPYNSYSYTDNSDCDVSLTKIDKDGNTDSVLYPEIFESDEYSFLKIEVSGSCDYAEPMLQLTDDLGAGDFEYQTEYPTRQGAACCPEGMCWNGYVCASNMAEYTYMTEEPQENQTYRCIDGVWSYLEPQWDWNGEEYGFCETEDQCFVTSSLSEGAEYGSSLTDFYAGTYPLCIDDGEYLLDHYCENGNWSSRTKFLATKLLDFAETDDFILYCAPFRDALPDYAVDGYNYENYLAGEVSATITEADSLATELTGDSVTGTTTEVCFDALENSETGRRLVAQEDNTCINAVCVLQYKSSDTFAAAFATSMNNNVTGDESFLIPLGIAQGDLETYCTSDNTTNFIECDDALWYNDAINSVIYAKEGISFDPSLIDSIVDWFLGLFGSDVIEDSEDFIDEAQNFNTIYLLSKEGYVVRAVQEIEADQETLVAEYENFDLPICDYVNNVNEEYTTVDQWPAEPEMLVSCELTEAGVYRIMTATNTDYWWPQLTSKLRVSAQ